MLKNNILSKLINNLFLQIILCFMLLYYIKCISPEYSILITIKKIFIDISLLVIIALLMLFIIIIKRYVRYNHALEFYYFIYWFIIIICIVILVFGYFETKYYQDYLIQTPYISIKYDYSLSYKVNYFAILLNDILMHSDITDHKKEFMRKMILNNDILLEYFNKYDIEHIRIICYLQLNIANTIYDHWGFLAISYENYNYHPIILFLRDIIVTLFMCAIFIHKIPSEILNKLFYSSLLLLIKTELLRRGLEIDDSMTEEQIMICCSLILNIVKKNYHPLRLLIKILKYKYGFI